MFFWVCMGLSVFWFYGAIACLVTAAFYIVMLIISLLMGSNKPFKHLPVRGWDPAKTKYDKRGLPFLDN